MMQLPNAKLIKQVQQHQQGSRARHTEPDRLIPGRRDTKVQRCAFFVPEAVVIAGDHAEAVVAGTKIIIKSLASSTSILPLLIVTLEFVSKANSAWNRETQRRVIDFQFSRQRRKLKVLKVCIILVIRE